MRLTYEMGVALGTAAGTGDFSFAGLLTDAIVLSRRHGDDLGKVAGLLWISEPGLRGFLDGARSQAHPSFAVASEGHASA